MSSSILVELHKIGWPLLFCLTVLCHVVLPSLSLTTEKKQTTVRICRTSQVPHPNLMPNGWCITTMTYRCSWLRLMVASAGEADRFSMKNKMSSISALCLLPTKMISFISSPWLRWRRSSLSRWCNFITQLAMNQMFPRRRIDVGTKSISFVLISKPSHNFVSSSPVILFVQLLTLIKKMVWTKNPDGRSSPPFLFTPHIRFDWSQTL